MYNLNNLNDYEFEILCKDIMQKILDEKLRVYKPGRDGGIDVKTYKGNDVIIQVKHYSKSSFSNLKSTLKSELEKVKILNPKQYYICTSQELSASNIEEIYNMFSEYMESSKNIKDGVEISEFLKLGENKDIVEKNYKLWLVSSNVLSSIYNQNIFIDSEELVNDIDKESSIYVDTSAYYNALNIIKKEGTVIIHGDPGVGKSTISKMVILKLISEGYAVKFSSDNSVKDIKKSLSQDPNKKEVVLLDDFLGQHYLDITNRKTTEIKALIHFIKKHENKKLILNTRITILNEAMRSSISFKEMIEDDVISKYRIDLNEITRYDKGKILYNHIYNSKLPRDYFDEIKKFARYEKIVSHTNYNPRIIQYVTKKVNYSRVDSSEYFDYIMNSLENPHDVWNDEFVNRMNTIDRLFINTLYSLTNTNINNRILEECFNFRCKYIDSIDSTLNNYDIVISRLSNSVIKIIADNDNRKIGVINPSVNDYINHSINKNVSEINSIISNAVYLDQIIKFINHDFTKDFIQEKIKNREFLNLKALTMPIEYFYLEFIVKYNIRIKELKDSIIMCFNSVSYSDTIYQPYSKIVLELLSSDLFRFYGLYEFIFTDGNLIKVIKNINIDEALDLLKFIVDEVNGNNVYDDIKDNIYEDVKDIIEIELFNFLKEDYNEFIDEIVSEIINDNYSTSKIHEMYDKGEDFFNQNIKEKILDCLNNDVEKFYNKTKDIGLCFEIDIETDTIVNNCNYIDAIDLYFAPDYDDMYDDYDDHHYNDYGNYNDSLNDIFDRDYDNN